MPAISVIVPVYNVEAYLRKCVDSILKQTFSDLEIILVDDGSTDNSGRICDDYLKKDSRIKVIHKANGGLSDARNAGLDICTGDYIGFVDSDDYVDEDMYELLYGNAKKCDADISMCKNRRVYSNRIEDDGCNKTICLDKKDDIIKIIYCGNIGASVCSKLYKKHIFTKLRFLKAKTSEDVYITLFTIEKANRVVISFLSKYSYIERIGSITELKKYSKKINDVTIAYKYNHEIISKKYPNSIEASEYRLFWAFRMNIERILKCVDANEHMDEVYSLQSILRENLGKISKNKYLNWKQRVAYLLICINCKLYMKVKYGRNG